MDNMFLNKTESLKYLGIIIDHKLNWTSHIAHVKNKISKVLALCSAQGIMSLKSLKTLYYSYIYPYVIYCIEIRGISPQTHLTPLLLLQKKIVRITTYSTFYTHTAPIFKELQILTVDKLVVHRNAIVMYKFNNGLLPAVLNTLHKKIMKYTHITQDQKTRFILHLELKPFQILVREFGMHS